ncbi:MAG: D-alanyl-D-alanine carboxypeptidase/D-alanyl-D-alanine-endopeptidase [Deltaproteobacteria bacterium]|nr:D-alanyl-D-alanine carboxypeptidase/D-alanyl-D-alanine-endopeptidase [Deltaproteobacteria bacterium]
MLTSIGLAALTLAAVGLPSDAPSSVEEQARKNLETQIQRLLLRPELKGAKVGLYVMRLDDGTELFAKNADVLMVPASNVKILTTAAALATLSPDYRFRTEIYGDLASDGTLRGDLTVKGYGDPGLVPERLWYLASRLYFLGARVVQGDLVVDDSFFDGPRLATGFEQDETASAYMAPSGAFSVGFNAAMIHVLPGPNGEARVLVDPASDYAKIDNKAKTVHRGRTSLSVDVEPQDDRSVIKVTGQIHAKDEGRGFWRRIDNPPLFGGEVLKKLLAQVGVTIKGKVRTGLAPTDAKLLVSLDSPRLAELLLRVNKNSSNFVAQQVALTMGAELYGAPGTWDKGRLAIEAFLARDVGIHPGSYLLANASGLHDVNRLTPRQLVTVLATMYRRNEVWPEFSASFAVAAGSGTLADRMRDTDAAHLLRAKTGTLSIASALSGFVPAKSGEPLAFSILVNDYAAPIADVWKVQDALGHLLASVSFNLPTAAAPVVSRTIRAEPAP